MEAVIFIPMSSIALHPLFQILAIAIDGTPRAAVYQMLSVSI